MLKKIRLAYFVSHPIQYQAPLLRLIASHPEIDLTVFFLSDISTREYYDEGFQRRIKWDVNLLDGYKHIFLRVKNRNHTNLSFLSPLNYSYLKYLNQEWDAVWVHGYANLTLNVVILYSFLRRIPVFFRGESIKEASKNGFFKNIYLKFIFSLISSFLYVSSKNKKYYLEKQIPESRLFFTPYSVDNDSFLRSRSLMTEQKIAKFKSSNTIPTDVPVILYLSKFIARKNPYLLLQVAHKLIEDGHKLHLLLVGDGPLKSQLTTYIKTNNLEKFVTILGFANQSELPLYYSSADIFVLPSIQEPFGLVIPEAMNFSLPIITSSEVGCSEDLVFNDFNGYKLDNVDFNELYNAITSLLTNQTSRLLFSKNSFELVSQWSYHTDLNGIVEALSCL